jgi:hypothetical protein
MKIAKLFLFVIMAITTSSCSNEGVDTPSSKSILGKWKTLKITDSKGVNMPLQPCGYNQLLTFFDDGSTTLMDPCQNITVSSTYKLDKNTLTVTTFDTSDKTTLVEKYTVLTLNSTTLRIQITWDSDYGTFPENERIIIEFVKDDTVPGSKTFKIILTGNAVTNTCDIKTNSFSIKAEYLADSNIFNSNTWNGSTNQLISDEKTIQGNIIGIKLKLLNFQINNQNSGRGTGITNVTIKILDTQNNKVLLEKVNIFNLFICTDSYYEATLLYNVQNNTFTNKVETHGF